MEAFRPHLASFSCKSNVAKRKDYSTNRSRASGWHAKTPNLQCVLCFTIKAGMNPQTPKQTQGSRQGGHRPQLGSPAALSCTSSPLLQALPARPPSRAALGAQLEPPGGSTWPSLTPGLPRLGINLGSILASRIIQATWISTATNTNSID